MSLQENGHDEAYGPENREYTEQRRLQSIHDAREAVIRVRNRARDPTTEIDEDVGNLALFQATKSYVIELEPLLMRAGEVGEQYLYGAPIAEFEVRHPDEAMEFYRNNRVVTGPPKPQTIEIGSLAAFLEVEPPFELRWQHTINGGGSSIEQESWTKEVGVPEGASNNAYRLCNEFLAEIGLDVEIEQLTDTEADADYSDIHSSEFDL